MFIFDASSVTVMPGLSRTTLRACSARVTTLASRSEEHTSELQSRLHLVCRLLLEKKKQTRCRPFSPPLVNYVHPTWRSGFPVCHPEYLTEPYYSCRRSRPSTNVAIVSSYRAFSST